VIRPLRDLTAYALVAAPALWLFVAVIRLIPSGVGQDFSTRVQNSFYGFVNLEILLMPLAAVLLATVVQPMHKHAKLITTVALVEYAVAAFFAVLFGFLIGLVTIVGWSVREAFQEFLVRAAWLAVFGAAAYAVFLIWRAFFHTPKPKQQPGMYGQPQQWQQQYGQPAQAQPGQPGFPPPGQPGYPQSPFAQPPVGAQPQPGQWGQPQGWGAPTSGHPTVQPGSAPPASTAPASAPPASAPPASPVSAQPASGGAPGTPPGPFAPAPGHPQAPGAYPGQSYPPPGYGRPQQPGGPADPTQAIPSHTPDDDRTRIVGEEPPRQ
jgi:hypothetical protein